MNQRERLLVQAVLRNMGAKEKNGICTIGILKLPVHQMMSSIYLFIYAVNKYLLSTCFVAGTMSAFMVLRALMGRETVK